jgi:Mn-dependent DtxR family transcriptional regulator
MRESDVHILEFLDNAGNREIVAPPAVIAANIDFEGATVRERVTHLRDAGLLSYHDQDAGYYQITELGKRYLAGELSDEEIDAIEAVLYYD